jgi:hypothetical protein
MIEHKDPESKPFMQQFHSTGRPAIRSFRARAAA